MNDGVATTQAGGSQSKATSQLSANQQQGNPMMGNTATSQTGIQGNPMMAGQSMGNATANTQMGAASTTSSTQAGIQGNPMMSSGAMSGQSGSPAASMMASQAAGNQGNQMMSQASSQMAGGQMMGQRQMPPPGVTPAYRRSPNQGACGLLGVSKCGNKEYIYIYTHVVNMLLLDF